MMGGRSMVAIRIVVTSFFREASHPETSMMISEKADIGRGTKDDSKVVKPKPLRAMLTKFWKPPAGIWRIQWCFRDR